MKKEDDRERMSDMELDRVVGGVNPAWLEVGALAHVTDGPFNSFDGVIEEINRDRQQVRVSIKIFGRYTPVLVDFDQISVDKPSEYDTLRVTGGYRQWHDRRKSK